MSITLTNAGDLAEIVETINVAFVGLQDGKEGWTSAKNIIEGHRVSVEYPLLLTNTETVNVLKYVDQDKILGCVRLEKMGEECFFGLLSIHPTAQGRRIGSQLLTASEEWAIQHGCTVMKCTVYTTRDSLVDYYIRRGFVDTGIRKPVPDRKESGPLKGNYELILLSKKLSC